MYKAMTNQEIARPGFLTSVQTDALLLLLAAPALLFPNSFPRTFSVIALLLLGFSFLLRYWQTGHITRYTHLNWAAFFLLLVLLPISLWVSPLPWEVTWPRVTVLAWSVWLYFFVLNWTGVIRASQRHRARLRRPTMVYLGLGLVVAIAGLLGMRSVDKFLSFSLPAIVENLTGLEARLPTNEIAGVLTLFIPFSAALLFSALQTRRGKLAVAMTVITAVMGLTLVLTQSRTGLVATAIATSIAFLLIVRPRPGWYLMLLVLAVVLLLLVAVTDVADPFIFAGANSWDSVIGPRQLVWEQGWHSALDFGLLGMGLGLFGRVAPLLYPQVPLGQAPLLEDAHNLYLQTILDFGLLGGLTLAVILLIALAGLVRLARHRRPGRLPYAWVIGLAAALVAHMLYSLTDAVALGTWAGIPLWFALGLSVAKTHDHPPERSAWPKMTVVFIIVAAVVGFAGKSWVSTNLASRETARALLTGQGIEKALNPIMADDGRCTQHWQVGLLHNSQKNIVARNAAWGKTLACSGRFTDSMSVLAPHDQALAAAAVAAQPEDAAGYFWQAGAVAGDNPPKAIELYRQGLLYAPDNGEGWLLLADILATNQPGEAMKSYLQACLHGDPGANGCWRSGKLAETSGNLALAVDIYQLSNWDGARERAAELEQQIDRN